MKLPDYIPRVVVHLDRPRTLAPTLAAMLRLKTIAPDADPATEEKKAQGLEQIGKYVWAFLIDDDREITVQDVESMIWMGNMEEVSAVIGKLMEEGNAVPAESLEGKAEEAPPISLSA